MGQEEVFFDAIINNELETANPFKKSKFKVEVKEFDRNGQEISWTIYPLF